MKFKITVMGIGFGSGSDMLSSYNSNRKQLKKSKSLQEVTEIHNLKGKGTNPKYKEISKEQLEEFRLKLREQKRKNDIKMYAVLTIVALALAVGMYIFLFQ